MEAPFLTPKWCSRHSTQDRRRRRRRRAQYTEFPTFSHRSQQALDTKLTRAKGLFSPYSRPHLFLLIEGGTTCSLGGSKGSVGSHPPSGIVDNGAQLHQDRVCPALERWQRYDSR